MLNFIIGRGGTGKSTRLLERVCQEQGGRGILIVPEPQSHETERRLCAVGGGRACFYAEVLTFSRLAARVFQTAGGIAREELSPGGRILLAYRAVQSVASQLKVYARPSRRPAFLTGLLEAMDELKSCCITPEQLAAAGEEIGGADGDRLGDLALIYATYTAMTSRIALDPGDRLTRAAEKLASCRWAEGTRVYLDGFIDFTPQQLQIIRLLMEQSGEVTVALTCDHLEEDEDGIGVFSLARRTAAQLERMARELGQDVRVETLSRPSPARSQVMRAVEAHLFDNGGETAACGDDVQLFCASDMRTEVEWTAAKILELVRTGGLRFRDIGVIARGYGRYDALVESVFEQYGVPVFRSAKSDVMQKPVLTLVTAALDAVTGGYDCEDMLRYLKTDLTDLTRDERDELENYVLCWELRGSRWTQEAPWNMPPRGYTSRGRASDDETVARMDALRRRVVAPLESLRKNTLKTGVGQAQALYSFLEKIELTRRLDERCARLREQGELGLADEYRQLWEILCSALEQCARLLGDAPMEMEEFVPLLRLVLSQYSVSTIPVSLDRVAAGELNRQSGHGVKTLFVLGADDGSLPGADAPAGLLTDDDRERLAGLGVELGARGKDRLHRAMTEIYTAFTCPDRALILTWPDRSGETKLNPAFPVVRLQKLFPDLAVQREGDGAFRLAAARPALEQAGRLEPVRRVLEQIPEWSEAAGRLSRATRWQRGRLSERAVKRLYGTHIFTSASRIEKVKSCHFAYFMEYGLKAEPRRTGVFSGTAYGTFVHDVLQHVIAADGWRGADGGVDTQALKNLTAQAVERYAREKLGDLEGWSVRERCLFHRLRRGVDRIVDNVARELAGSKFIPLAFELGFGNGKNAQMPPIEMEHDGVRLTLTGYVDRVDGYERDGKLYLRVIDYKTYDLTFDFSKVAGGLGLQMLLYLFALREHGAELFGKEIVPAGVLYLPVYDVAVNGRGGPTDEEVRRKRDNDLRRTGLVLDEPEILDAMEVPADGTYRFLPFNSKDKTSARVTMSRFAELEEYVRSVMREICTELGKGNIDADPYWRAQKINACEYCQFAAACNFEQKCGDRYHHLRNTSAEEFWQSLEREKNGEEATDRGGTDEG